MIHLRQRPIVKTENMKKIIQGEKFVCIKKVRCWVNGETKYFKGVIYLSKTDECICGEDVNPQHYWKHKKEFKKHFVKLK